MNLEAVLEQGALQILTSCKLPCIEQVAVGEVAGPLQPREAVRLSVGQGCRHDLLERYEVRLVLSYDFAGGPLLLCTQLADAWLAVWDLGGTSSFLDQGGHGIGYQDARSREVWLLTLPQELALVLPDCVAGLHVLHLAVQLLDALLMRDHLRSEVCYQLLIGVFGFPALLPGHLSDHKRTSLDVDCHVDHRHRLQVHPPLLRRLVALPFLLELDTYTFELPGDSVCLLAARHELERDPLVQLVLAMDLVLEAPENCLICSDGLRCLLLPLVATLVTSTCLILT